MNRIPLEKENLSTSDEQTAIQVTVHGRITETKISDHSVEKTENYRNRQKYQTQKYR